MVTGFIKAVSDFTSTAAQSTLECRVYSCCQDSQLQYLEVVDRGQLFKSTYARRKLHETVPSTRRDGLCLIRLISHKDLGGSGVTTPAVPVRHIFPSSIEGSKQLLPL